MAESIQYSIICEIVMTPDLAFITGLTAPAFETVVAVFTMYNFFHIHAVASLNTNVHHTILDGAGVLKYLCDCLSGIVDAVRMDSNINGVDVVVRSFLDGIGGSFGGFSSRDFTVPASATIAIGMCTARMLNLQFFSASHNYSPFICKPFQFLLLLLYMYLLNKRIRH
jgi:hypothetical protein